MSSQPNSELERLTWVASPAPEQESTADRYLRLACLTWDRDSAQRRNQAADLLAADPSLPEQSIAVAAAVTAIEAIGQHLAGDPGAASRPSGPYGWSPLMYLCYARGGNPASENDALESARTLLAAGADPNDGRYFRGLPTPFTLLTGLFGGGESSDQPPHPHALPLARLLLAAGADPNDGQALYNRMFDTDDDWLRSLLESGLGQGDGGPWHRRLPDLTDSPQAMLRGLLGWAIVHDQRDRVALLATHGVDLDQPLHSIGPLRIEASPVRLALANGHRAMADQLREHGARPVTLEPIEQFLAAVLSGDEDAVSQASAATIEQARTRRPGLVVWAASQRRPAAIELLVAHGWDVNALARGDVPLEQPWQSALHTAVERDDAALIVRLLELGADPTLRDARFDGTAADWAHHLGYLHLLVLLGEPAPSKQP